MGWTRGWIAALVVAVGGLLGAARAAAAAELKIVLPLGRAAYQTNERIDLAVVRAAPEALAAGDLALTLVGDDGSRLAFTFPAGPGAVQGQGGQGARRTEHLHLDGRLLRPGRYAIEAACDGAAARAEIDVYSHVRQTDFRLIYWAQGNAKGPFQQVMGEGGMGFNLFWGQGDSWSEHLVRGGLDYMQCCTMGGGHQMDLRMECDWSDPYVLGGAVARVARQALVDRTRPNVLGVHFYDEPGLTWSVDPATRQETPHTIPSQLRSFRSALDRDRVPYREVGLDKPETLAQWVEWNRFHLQFLDAASKLANFGVTWAQADFLSANQSMYAWYAFGDGYYFNVQRSMPVIGGHGGYDEWGSGFLHPGLFMAMGRARDLAKPCWYMPTWGGQTSDRLRMQQYLSFMQNLQGMMVAPPTQVAKPWAEPAADGAVESNLLMGRLGTVFATMPVTRPPVAVLYSISQNIHVQAALMARPHDEAAPGNYGNAQTAQLRVLYTACCMSQYPFFPIVEEDVLDGTLAADHKAVILPKVDALDPRVVAALEAFIGAGGAVFASDDAAVAIKGARKLGVAISAAEATPSEIPAHLKAAEPVAAALKARMKEAGIPPVFGCDNPAIAAWRQADGDVEYLFAVNAACDVERGGYNPIRPTVATIRFPADGRPVYDAVLGGPAALKPAGKELVGQFRFGAGQMRVFARTARPVGFLGHAKPNSGAVRVATPVLRRDFTAADMPLAVDVSAMIVDDTDKVLSGSVPLEIRLVDPLGATRYCLNRATDRGGLRISLPLAANDPPGEWKVVVQELLARTQGEAAFTYRPGAQCGAVAGAAPRAVFFGNDRQNVFRFFRLHHDVTIVTGKGDYNSAAAERLTKVLAPWGVRTKTVTADEVNKPHPVPEEANRTWVGLEFGRIDPAKLDPGHTGFALDGPAILLGTPEDNPLIKFLKDRKFLPYTPARDEFPGRGRGMVAWQTDGIGYFNQESITLIAYDAEGMAEAVGTLYEACAGMDPLMKWVPPASAAVTAAARAPSKAPEAAVAWRMAMPDRAAAIRPMGEGFLILTKDGTLASVDAAGKTAWQQPMDGGESWSLDASADGSVIAVGATHHVAVFDGRGRTLADAASRFPRPGAEGKPVSAVTFVAVSPDGKRIAAGTADGILIMLDAKGKTVWSVGGLSNAEVDNVKRAMEEWTAGAGQRAAEMKEFKAVEETWKAAVAAWEKADPKARGPKPERPQAPKHPPQPRLPQAKPYAGGVFSPDARTLVVSTRDGAGIVSAEDGHTIAPVGGLAGRVPVLAAGSLLVASGDGVALVSPADGKTAARMTIPKATVIGAVPVGEGAVVAVAEDGRVVQLKSLGGNVEESTAWDFRQPGRMPKKLGAAAGLTAVAYWGGTVTVLDAAGKVKSSQRLGQDVADMAWVGGKLIVGLADGTVVALSAK